MLIENKERKEIKKVQTFCLLHKRANAEFRKKLAFVSPPSSFPRTFDRTSGSSTIFSEDSAQSSDIPRGPRGGPQGSDFYGLSARVF